MAPSCQQDNEHGRDARPSALPKCLLNERGYYLNYYQSVLSCQNNPVILGIVMEGFPWKLSESPEREEESKNMPLIKYNSPASVKLKIRRNVCVT